MSEQVYFARRADGTGPIKIGMSRDARYRVHQITQDAGSKVVMLATVNCRKTANGLERRFHAYFEPSHIGGEWFAATPTLLKTIDQVNAGTFDFAALPAEGWQITKGYQCKASVEYYGDLGLPSPADVHAMNTRKPATYAEIVAGPHIRTITEDDGVPIVVIEPLQFFRVIGGKQQRPVRIAANATRLAA